MCSWRHTLLRNPSVVIFDSSQFDPSNQLSIKRYNILWATLKSQALQNLLAFPSFLSCPLEDSIDLQYYFTEDGSYFRPSRHRCLLAEVVRVENVIRLRLHVRDRAGQLNLGELVDLPQVSHSPLHLRKLTATNECLSTGFGGGRSIQVSLLVFS